MKAKESGYIAEIDSEGIGFVSLLTGAGRTGKDDAIDYSAGLIINFGLGDYAEKDSVLMTLYSNDKNKLEEAARRAENIFRLTDRPTDQPPLIYSVI